MLLQMVNQGLRHATDRPLVLVLLGDPDTEQEAESVVLVELLKELLGTRGGVLHNVHNTHGAPGGVATLAEEQGQVGDVLTVVLEEGLVLAGAVVDQVSAAPSGVLVDGHVAVSQQLEEEEDTGLLLATLLDGSSLLDGVAS
eukprot:254636_1